MKQEVYETINIRRATVADLKIIQQFGFKLLDFERKNWDASLDPKWPFSDVGGQKYQEAIENKYTIIAEDEDTPVGFLIGKVIDISTDSARNVKQARLENIYVDEKYRKNGIGSALFEDFRNFCQNSGVTRLDVGVFFDNEEAVRFYKKVGFKPLNLNLSQNLRLTDFPQKP